MTMTSDTKHQVLTAKRLDDGQVVYLAAGENWTHRLAEAHVASDAATAAALQSVAEKAVAGRVIVDPYLFEVDPQAGAIQPLRTREVIRARGPSVRPDLGYQAAER
jgi:hypothetical protein